MITVRNCSGPEQAQQQAAVHLNNLFYSRKGKPVLFLSSGGSAFHVLNLINTRNLDNQVTLSVLDERFSPDQTINNFAQLMKMPFFAGSQAAGCQFIDTRIAPGDTLAGCARRWEKQLRDWTTTYPNGQIVATLGVGPDSHTAGIMPYPEAPEIFDTLFCQPNSWVVGYNATGKNQYPNRVTTTITFLKEKINHSIVIATGAEKHEVLRKVMTSQGSLSQTPARVFHEMKDLILFTDREIM